MVLRTSGLEGLWEVLMDQDRIQSIHQILKTINSFFSSPESEPFSSLTTRVILTLVTEVTSPSPSFLIFKIGQFASSQVALSLEEVLVLYKTYSFLPLLSLSGQEWDNK